MPVIPELDNLNTFESPGCCEREGFEFSLPRPDLSLSCYSTVALLEWPQASIPNQSQCHDNTAREDRMNGAC